MTLAALSPALAGAQIPGVYVGNQPEIAAGLRLTADGRFDYGLVYGALGERAKGRWAERGGTVLLTTEPVPRPAVFRIVSDNPSADGKLHVALDDPDALGGLTLTVRVFYAGAEKPEFIEVEEDGTVPLPPGRVPVAVVPDLPVYDIPLEPYSLMAVDRSLVFRFEENDLAVADFREEPLAIDGDALVLRRHDRSIRFEKARN